VTALSALLSASCSREPIMEYRNESGVYFTNFAAKYTFVENMNMLEQGSGVLNVPVRITGLAQDGRRTFKAAVYTAEDLYIEGETPAEAGMYAIGEGYVEAGMFEGTLPVTINYKPQMDEREYTAYIHIIPSDDFPVTDLNGQPLRLTFGNVITRPENWTSRLQRYFGEYSDSWYAQILKWTGKASLPYYYTMGADQPGITAEQAERWPMSLNEVKVYAFLVMEALAEWKNDNPGKEMLHEDGPMEGQPVKMGTF
jgi:hypothetical protein